MGERVDWSSGRERELIGPVWERELIGPVGERELIGSMGERADWSSGGRERVDWFSWGEI